MATLSEKETGMSKKDGSTLPVDYEIPLDEEGKTIFNAADFLAQSDAVVSAFHLRAFALIEELFKKRDIQLTDEEIVSLEEIVFRNHVLPSAFNHYAMSLGFLYEIADDAAKGALKHEEVFWRMYIRLKGITIERRISDDEKAMIRDFYTEVGIGIKSLSRIFKRGPASISDIVKDVSHPYKEIEYSERTNGVVLRTD